MRGRLFIVAGVAAALALPASAAAHTGIKSRSPAPGTGQDGRASQAPGQPAGKASGSAYSWRNTVNAGSASTPLSIPFSHRSKKRIIS